MDDHDNIADEPPINGAVRADDAELDEYVQRFDKLGTLSDELTQLKQKLADARTGDERIAALVKCVFKLDQINQEQHALLIEMNNIFGKGAN